MSIGTTQIRVGPASWWTTIGRVQRLADKTTPGPCKVTGLLRAAGTVAGSGSSALPTAGFSELERVFSVTSPPDTVLYSSFVFDKCHNSITLSSRKSHNKSSIIA